MIRTQAASNNPSFDIWRDGLATDARNMRGATWKLIRRLGEGRANYGDELFWQAVHDTQLSEGTVTNYLSLFNLYFIPRETFRVNVPVAIHEAIRTLDADQRDTVLEISEKLGWTRENVRDRMEGWKAGDTKAWDPRWKPHKSPKLSAQTPNEEKTAGGCSNDSKEDAPVMDGTGVGAALNAEAKSEERREVLAGLRDQSLSSANQRLLAIMTELKDMRSDAGFLAQIEPAGINATALATEAQWLVNVAAEIKHRQNAEWGAGK